jgi:hypothetical protein
MPRPTLTVLVVGVVTLATGIASAQSGQDDDSRIEEARTLFEQGLQAYEGGEVAVAAALFVRSLALREAAPVLYNLAMCRRELDQKNMAITAFRRYVELRGPDLPATERAEIEQMVREMGGTLPEVTATTEPTPPPTPPTPPDTSDEPAAPADGDEGVDQAWFWATAGTAVALGIGAGITGGLLYATHQDFVNGGSTDQDLADKGDALLTTTYALAGLAGAAAAAAIVLAFFTDFGAESDEDAEGVGVAWVAPGGLALTW